MKRFGNAVLRLALRRSGLLGVIAVVAVLVPVIFLARSGDSESTGSSVAIVAVIGLLIVVAVLAVVSTATVLAGVDPEAQSIASRLATAPDEQRLLTRWLERTRWTRNVGGFAGIVWWVFATRSQGDLLLYGLGGVAVGSMLAQLHQVRRATGLRTASLDRRTVAEYSPPRVRRRMAMVGVAAALLCVFGISAEVSSDQGGAAATIWGLGAVLVLAATAALQERVARRPRPALTTGLRYADDLARVLAIGKGLGEPAAYLAVVIIGHGAAQLEPSVGDAATAVSTVAWFYALFLWWGNRRLGLHHLLKENETGGQDDPQGDPDHRMAAT